MLFHLPLLLTFFIFTFIHFCFPPSLPFSLPVSLFVVFLFFHSYFILLLLTYFSSLSSSLSLHLHSLISPVFPFCCPCSSVFLIFLPLCPPVFALPFLPSFVLHSFILPYHSSCINSPPFAFLLCFYGSFFLFHFSFLHNLTLLFYDTSSQYSFFPPMPCSCGSLAVFIP